MSNRLNNKKGIQVTVYKILSFFNKNSQNVSNHAQVKICNFFMEV